MDCARVLKDEVSTSIEELLIIGTVETIALGADDGVWFGQLETYRLGSSFSLAPGLFVCGCLLMFAEPRCIFAYYMAPFYKRACSSEFWIEHTNVGRKRCQKSTKICYSIVFERCLAHSFRSERPAGTRCSWIAIVSSRERGQRFGVRKRSRRRHGR